MQHKVRFAAGVFMVCLLVSCGAPAAVPSTTLPQVAEVIPEPASLPLSAPGPYRVGVREFSTNDASRDDRNVGVRVWYPALEAGGEAQKPAMDLAEPDHSGAPYPLIVSSAKVGAIFAPHVVTHGFVWAGVTRIDTYRQFNAEMVEQPLDILFALDQVASNPPEELAGMIDAGHTGVTGYSFDGTNALVLSGARVDPQFYLAQCAVADATAEAILSTFPSRYQCPEAGEWLAYAAQGHEAIASSEDGLWQPMTDARIRAVAPLAAEGWLLFGERGLAAVELPVLLVVATDDELYAENMLILEKLGTPDKALISFVGQDHMMVYRPAMVARMAHFLVAFFGYHLQGREELAHYFSESFVGQYGDLAWGVYEGE